MKNKLKALFAYFRGFKQKEIDINISYSYNDEEEFNDISITSQMGYEKKIKIAKPIKEIIDELNKKLMPTFHFYNDYEEDEWWSLEMTIYPFENKINFKSECKYLNEAPEKFENDLSALSPETRDKIEQIQVEDDLAKIQFDFDYSYGETILDNLLFDGKEIDLTDDLKDLLYNVLNELFRKEYGAWWRDEGGFYGDITIWGYDIFVDLTKLIGEWEMTDMNLTITPDFFDDTDEK